LLVSPTEQKLKELGTVSSLPEQYGADFLFPGKDGLVGVQRKEIRDLVASLHDGRLAKELGQMKSLAQAILLVEGEVRWSSSGNLMAIRRPFTRAQWYGVMFSVQSSGLWVISTDGVDESRIVLPLVEKWLQKNRHGSLAGRPNPNGDWGTVGSRDWGIHLLQSFQGIGAETAGRIYDYFEGVPLGWMVSQGELQNVKGVGKGRAETLYRALGSRLRPGEK